MRALLTFFASTSKVRVAVPTRILTPRSLSPLSAVTPLGPSYPTINPCIMRPQLLMWHPGGRPLEVSPKSDRLSASTFRKHYALSSLSRLSETNPQNLTCPFQYICAM